MTDTEKIADLELKLAEALAEIARLNALLGKKVVKKTSANSHLSPSMDLNRSLEKNRSLRTKSEKPVGGQIGHEGHTLLQSESPDVIVDLVPAYCNACGKSLSEAEFELLGSRQVVDIPPITAITTAYRCFGTKCSCGHATKGSYPSGVAQPIQYGENVQSLSVYLSVFQFVPFGRLQDFFKNVCNLAISKGTIENMIRRTSDKAEPVYAQIAALISKSFYVGADETGFKCKGEKHWFWVWQNMVLTYIVAAASRAKSVITDTFPEGLPQTILGSDRLAAQLSTVRKGFQLCIVHLLRDLQYLCESEKMAWATDFKTLLKDAINLKQAKPAYLPDDPLYIDIITRANNLLKLAVLEQQLTDETLHKETITFFTQMRRLQEGLFPFLLDERIPFDNNGSERAIRNVKVKMKVSGQFKALHHQFAVLRSVIDTARKNGQPVWAAIQAIVNLPMPTSKAG